MDEVRYDPPSCGPQTRTVNSMITGPGLVRSEGILQRALGFVPRILASHGHILWLIALGIYLIFLPLAGVSVSAKAELVGGNYANVTGDIGACIAAGGTLNLLRHARRRTRLAEASHEIVAELFEHSTGHRHPADLREPQSRLPRGSRDARTEAGTPHQETDR